MFCNRISKAKTRLCLYEEASESITSVAELMHHLRQFDVSHICSSVIDRQVVEVGVLVSYDIRLNATSASGTRRAQSERGQLFIGRTKASNPSPVEHYFTSKRLPRLTYPRQAHMQGYHLYTARPMRSFTHSHDPKPMGRYPAVLGMSFIRSVPSGHTHAVC